MRVTHRTGAELRSPLETGAWLRRGPWLSGSSAALVLAGLVAVALAGWSAFHGPALWGMLAEAGMLLLVAMLAPRVLADRGDHSDLPEATRHEDLSLSNLATTGEGSPSPSTGDCSRCHMAEALHRVLQESGDAVAKLRQFEAHRANYVATVSHELRTPLTSIKGFAQLLTREEVSADSVKRYASTIAAEADKLARVVKDIVDLTRMETSLLQLRPQPIHIDHLIGDVVGAMEPVVSPPQHLQFRSPATLPAVRGDPQRVRQVIETLAADAIGRSYPDAPVAIAALSRGDGVEVRLEYRAAARRIEELARALDHLGQGCGDGEATQLGRGDLDLYICKNFVEAHGGRMWFEHPDEETVAIAFMLPC